MIDQFNHLKKNAERIVSDLWRRRDGLYVYRQINAPGAGLPLLEPPEFEREWICARLAVGCMAWGQACLENKIADEGVRKAFLRYVMELFTSQKLRPFAEIFSEYLHSNTENDSGVEMLAVAACFFKRMKRSSSLEWANADGTVHAAFKNMVYLLEAAKSDIQKQFEEQRSDFF